ncbi:TIGR02680 family protein [Ornithinimicrobium cerasi]|uniref:TIGR02680 family protein n=1 Tax=Ornithinimicrobium cerasi TaxID=2248773 RepID=A0A285VHR1_9MICO|nr:TIGR02680 family protein [Ornithinimicrobium cerasi]SOC53609.1 TIGR02680 family protein [Ornithinimicrobium cerasi]
MSLTLPGRSSTPAPNASRFRLSRAGILNVWQYDEQVFTFADGRLLLRGANGAGKSKTLEMLLPFALDGDKARLTASAKHHTSLLWLMTDGVEGGNRVGYVWVEFARTTPEGEEEHLTCGVGIRASSSARTATAWHFATDQRLGTDFELEDTAGPLPQARLREVLGADRVFDRAADYKAHVGRVLFGLDPRHYDEVLRLLYWLRQPQVGEDIEPARLTQQLSQALPQLDEQSVRAAADTFDELTAFGEQIDRRAAAAAALTALAQAYADYARAVLAARGRSVVAVVQEETRLRGALHRAEETLGEVEARQAAARAALTDAEAGVAADEARLATLRDSPEFRDQRRLGELSQQAGRDAELARDAAARVGRARLAAERTGSALGQARDELGSTVDLLSSGVRAAAEALRKTVRDVSLTTTLTSQSLDDELETASVVGGGLDHLAEAVQAATSAVTRRRAGVGVVRGALDALSRAEGHQATVEREAEQTEARWDEARGARAAAEAEADRQVEALLAALAEWVGQSDAPTLTLPDELTAGVVEQLGRLAADAAAPQLGELRDTAARAGAAARAAREELERLRSQRAAVEAERDPAPPPPPLPRTSRTDGSALWQVVDFADRSSREERAGLEAALQASGLLDAWVRPGGRLLDAGLHDVVLATGPTTSPSLADALRVDVPDGSDVSETDVAAVLRGIALGGEGSDPRVGTDGSWRLGPAEGRAGKEVAQYVGATARAQERARRLAALDAELAAQQQVLDANEQERVEAAAGVAALEEWVAAAPSGTHLLSAWQRADLLLETEQREEGRNQRAQSAAQAARAETAHRTDDLRRLALEHDLPSDATALDAVEEALRRVTDDLRDLDRDLPHARRTLTAWTRAREDHDLSLQTLDAEVAAADAARRQAEVTAAAHEELRATVGDSVAELDRRISATRTTLEQHRRTVVASRRSLEELLVDLGQGRTGVEAARERLTDHATTRSAALASLVEALRIDGLPEAADVGAQTSGALLSLDLLDPSAPVPRGSLAAARSLTALSEAEVHTVTTRLYERYGSATSGPAAEHQPALATLGELHTVSGRDEAGEAAVTLLARRVAAGVERDRELLTRREREQFERHVLGELGETLRRCRRDAQELVEAMNSQLGHVTTSQGIRVRLDWKLRDDVAAEAREAVDLLTQPVGALLPEERAKLHDALHRLIEASRAEHPELSYSEHLAAALDYRTWFAFTIRYTRPEAMGRWERLHRRSPLSQGEQKVLCYLPLFAAAAAHFTSLAGAAPHAPRLVLLDDAFPKIDVRTHPLLFGLLVQLDLDFVITSERLWGDHPTVPSLAIYEALRDPAQRGIAQYEYRWDGRTLESVG